MLIRTIDEFDKINEYTCCDAQYYIKIKYQEFTLST